jgi:hypothetical protein
MFTTRTYNTTHTHTHTHTHAYTYTYIHIHTHIHTHTHTHIHTQCTHNLQSHTTTPKTYPPHTGGAPSGHRTIVSAQEDRRHDCRSVGAAQSQVLSDPENSRETRTHRCGAQSHANGRCCTHCAHHLQRRLHSFHHHHLLLLLLHSYHHQQC